MCQNLDVMSQHHDFVYHILIKLFYNCVTKWLIEWCVQFSDCTDCIDYARHLSKSNFMYYIDIQLCLDVAHLYEKSI